MARRRRKSRKTSVAITRKPRRARRRNPSARALARRAGGSARRTFGGMNIMSAVKNVPIAVLGMMAAKWSAKRFGEGELEDRANETDAETWTGMSYLKGSIGAFAAGFVAQMVKPGWGQKVLEGGLCLMGYKLLQNELIPKSEWASRQFGAEDQEVPIQYDDQGTPYLLGSNGQWYPADERHRLPEAVDGMGDALERPGSLGDVLERPGSMGAIDPWSLAYQGRGNESGDPFARAFHG